MESGAQPGNKNATKNKPWSDAIRKAIIQGKSLDTIAKKLIAKAVAGDLLAIKEIGDRLEGRPQQSIVGADDGPLTIQIIKYAGSDTE